MKKAASGKSATRIQEIEPFDKRRVDLAKFKPELSDKELHKLLGSIGDIIAFPFLPIETLSPTKTIGLGRTNLTFIAPTVVQIDTPTPRATFDVRAQTRHPGIQMHFEPIAYGITSVAMYFMEFTIQVSGQSTFNLSGYAGGPGHVLNDGTKVLNGQTTVTLVLKNVDPTQHTSGFLEETSGVDWQWFRTKVRFPPIVVSL
jgi:hypothetical protein